MFALKDKPFVTQFSCAIIYQRASAFVQLKKKTTGAFSNSGCDLF